MFKKIFDFIIDSLQALVFALAIFALTYFFIAQPNKVKGHSMMPNFHNRDLILTEKISYRFNNPKRGDVVIFKAPPSEPCSIDQCEYIKRVIGLPNETIKLDSGRVYINGRLLKESYLKPTVQTKPESFLGENKVFHIPPHNYMLFGDNRPGSRDSRAFGPINKSRIVGKAFLRYWPLSAVSFIKRPLYQAPF